MLQIYNDVASVRKHTRTGKKNYPLTTRRLSANAKKEKEQLAAKSGAAPAAPVADPVAAPVARPAPAAAPVVPPPAPRELRERGTHVSNLGLQLGYGDKVTTNLGDKVTTKPNSTENAKRQQLKRGRETFSGPENAGMTIPSDADCEGTIKTKVVKTDKGRDLPVRVCEEER